MPAPHATNQRLKAACSVSEMAKLVGLSRARFYQLVSQGVFLAPVYSMRTKRPLYTREMAERNLEVRQSQRGIHGEYILFYEPREPEPSNRSRSTRQRRGTDGSEQHADLRQQLRGLGLDATAEQVQQAVAECFPQGRNGADQAEVLRMIYRHLRRRNAD